ncbi:MAG: zinc ribbon domain-containing protein [Gammaproteobacteria bacterium]|nr:zinc ribbon domain-containing protein [Gammaproteobacteria bacterium]
MQHRNWDCPKCRNREFDVEEVRTTGGIFSRIFDIQNRKFVAVTCTNCTYTELYKSRSSKIGNVLDFLTQ